MQYNHMRRKRRNKAGSAVAETRCLCIVSQAFNGRSLLDIISYVARSCITQRCGSRLYVRVRGLRLHGGISAHVPDLCHPNQPYVSRQAPCRRRATPADLAAVAPFNDVGFRSDRICPSDVKQSRRWRGLAGGRRTAVSSTGQLQVMYQ